MAEVPYGGNGFTLLLSSVSRQRRLLAEAAQNAVPRVGSGAEGSNIFVCRDVSQADTGRQGSARLVLANVDLAQLDEQRLERLQWKLERFLDSLDDLLPDIPQVTGRDCGPVVSARLREWEEELKVAQLPAARALRGEGAAEGAATTALPFSGWKSAASIITVLLLLGSWILWPGEKPAGVAVDAETASDGMSTVAESAAVDGVQQIGAEQSQRIARKPASVRPELKPLAELVRGWRKDREMTAVPGVEELYTELVKRGWKTASVDEEQEIVDWLGNLWYTGPEAGEESDIQTEWGAVAANLKHLGAVAETQNFAGRDGLAARLPAVRDRFDRDLLRALLIARKSQLISHAANIFQFQYADGNESLREKFAEMVQEDVAIRSVASGTGASGPAREVWESIGIAEPDLDRAFTAFRNYGGEIPPIPVRLADEFQGLLKTLHKLLNTELVIGIQPQRLNSRNRPQVFGSAAQSPFHVLELLHSETLSIRVDNRGYILGGIAGREYWRGLLAQASKEKSAMRHVPYHKENDPVEIISLKFGSDVGSNATWFEERDTFRQQLKVFDESMKEARTTVPGDVTEVLKR
ncbi:MAG: hypothetical protein ACKO2P_20100 [Planctomycetota bacterium]